MSDAVELMLKVNQYSKKNFENIIDEIQKESNKKIDPKKF